MSLSALVYRNRNLSEDELAVIGSVDTETGQPQLREGETDYSDFAAREIFIGNLLGVAWLRRELELNDPTLSEGIREMVLSNGTVSGVAIGRPQVSRIASECSTLLAHPQDRLHNDVKTFIAELNSLANTALDENNPIVLI